MNNKHITVMHHKFKVGDKVRHKFDGAEGEIAALLPFIFLVPAYYVRINGMVTAVSERSLEMVENASQIDER